ncbi:MAG: thiamine diphosphokinase [Clostridia bacterium]|nr:thiamine diphosphokinase [Clostridia bacterium]MBO4429228.1 thiamine diphosphokinase [Clostridia bacterium]
MKKVLIVTPYVEGDLKDIIKGKRFDAVICADASLDAAKSAGLTPDVVIGDFDHGTKPDFEKIIEVPCEKDDTDTMLCVKHAIASGASDIFIAGGIGGRLDHTIANVQTLAYADSKGVRAVLADKNNEATVVTGNAAFKKRSGYFSLFAYGGKCVGVTLKGTKYTLDDATLRTSFPLGVSNEITADEATLEIREGTALVVFAK